MPADTTALPSDLEVSTRGGSRAGPRRHRQARGRAPRAGRTEARPDPGRRRHHPRLRRSHRRRRRTTSRSRRGVITALIGPNGAGKTTFFNLLTGFDRPDTGTWSFKGTALNKVPAYKVARMGMVRTFQLTKVLSKLTVIENMRIGATGQKGERLRSAMFKALWRAQEDEVTAARRPAAGAVPARQEARGLRRLAVGGPAQAARDGPGADGRPRAGDARRADGRGEPGAQAVAARSREVAARRGHAPCCSSSTTWTWSATSPTG